MLLVTGILPLLGAVNFQLGQVYYHYNIVQQLKLLFLETFSPPKLDPAVSEMPTKLAGKKQKDERQGGKEDKKLKLSMDAASMDEQGKDGLFVIVKANG